MELQGRMYNNCILPFMEHYKAGEKKKINTKENNCYIPKLQIFDVSRGKKK